MRIAQRILIIVYRKFFANGIRVGNLLEKLKNLWGDHISPGRGSPGPKVPVSDLDQGLRAGPGGDNAMRSRHTESAWYLRRLLIASLTRRGLQLKNAPSNLPQKD
jgi:hypothetical protein